MAVSKCVFSLFVFLASCLIVQSSCPPGWERRPTGSTCFLVERRGRVTYRVAKDRCLAHDSHLALPFDSQDWAWLRILLNDVDRNDTDESGFWMGLDNLQGRWNSWNSTQVKRFHLPQRGTNMTGRFLAAFLSRRTVWTTSVGDHRKIVCERPDDAPMYCDGEEGWEYLSGSCYKTVQGNYSWSDAQDACESENAHLPVVGNAVENEYLAHLSSARLGADLWLGLRRQSAHEAPGPQGWRWLDDQSRPVAPSFWSATERQWNQSMGPSNSSQCGFVPVIENGWKVVECQMGKVVVCQRKAGSCQSGWERIGDLCYSAQYAYVPLTRSLAATHCASIYNASLLTIKSERETRMLLPFLEQAMDMERMIALWLGVTALGNGTLVWDDGTEASYNNLAPGQEQSLGHGVNCLTVGSDLTMGSDEGDWYVAEDCQDIAPFVCQKPVSTTPWLAPRPSSSPLTCPQGWELFGQQCYLVVEEYLTWLQARDACGHHDAHLATVNDSEPQYAVSYIATHMPVAMWIGLQDSEQDNVFRWNATGEEVGPFTYWNSTGSNWEHADCVGVFSMDAPQILGLWLQMICSREQYALCQKPARVCRDKLPRLCPMTADLDNCSSPWTHDNCLVSCDRCHVLWERTEQSEGVIEVEGENDDIVETSPRCGHGWRERPGSPYCYKAVDLQLTWTAALDHCADREGAELASITTAEEQDFVTEVTRALNVEAVWLGGTRLSDDYGWTWEDGSTFAFINWHSEDEILVNDMCITMSRWRESKWFSESCTVRNAFVCKKKAADYDNATTPEISPVSTKFSCQEGWHEFRGTCFLFQQASVTWFEARDQCRERGAHLATIGRDFQNDFIWIMLPTGEMNATYWIGLSAGSDGRTFSWDSGAEVTYTSWEPVQPSFVNASGATNNTGCVSFIDRNGRWTPQNCERNVSGYVCSKPGSNMSNPLPNSPQTGCPQGALAYEHLCYMVEQEPRTWPEAESECQRRGRNGHLAAIMDSRQQAFFTAEVCPELGSRGWLGMSRETRLAPFTWTSEQPLTFTNWHNCLHAVQSAGCVLMGSDGYWNISDCVKPRPYVCQLLREGYDDVTVTPQPVTPLPRGPPRCYGHWLKVGDSCYAIAQDHVTQEEGEERCRSHNAHLGSVHSAEDFNHLRRRLTFLGLGDRRFWIGMIRLVSGHWTWSNSRPVTFFTPVSKEEVLENCWVLNAASTKFLQESCTRHHSTLCSRPLAYQPQDFSTSGNSSTSSTPTSMATPPPTVPFHRESYRIVTPKSGVQRDTTPHDQPSTIRVRLIVSCTLGGALALSAIIAFVIWECRRRRNKLAKKIEEQASQIQPNMAATYSVSVVDDQCPSDYESVRYLARDDMVEMADTPRPENAPDISPLGSTVQ